MNVILSQIECHPGYTYRVKVAGRYIGDVYTTYRAARKAERDELRRIEATEIAAAIVERQKKETK